MCISRTSREILVCLRWDVPVKARRASKMGGCVENVGWKEYREMRRRRRRRFLNHFFAFSFPHILFWDVMGRGHRSFTHQSRKTTDPEFATFQRTPHKTRPKIHDKRRLYGWQQLNFGLAHLATRRLACVLACLGTTKASFYDPRSCPRDPIQISRIMNE